MTVGPIRRRNVSIRSRSPWPPHLELARRAWIMVQPLSRRRVAQPAPPAPCSVASGTKAGVPDILLLANGRLFGLELKADHGRISPAQLRTHAEMRAAGATIGVATGIDEALELLGIWGLLRQ